MQRIFWQQGADGLFSYRHYGILLGDDSVVHFTGQLFSVDRAACIRRTDMEFFCAGGNLQRADDVRCVFAPSQIAVRALCQVGTDFGGYHFLRNNCEHFTNWCANGHKLSKQVLFR
ncbi:MAG: lecithin retinol acyltransferase family protein [Clostridia bacterium]|nr:lecithin retinol acyltransferase family protein [Clostridia bacterium]